MLNLNRNELRQYFFNSWNKFQAKLPLESMEQQVVDVILLHPEYHFIFASPEKYIDHDFFPELDEPNPFLHLSLHLSIREQVTTNRPAGIRALFDNLSLKKAKHELEHDFMTCLAETLWLAQKNGQMPDETAYLENLVHNYST